MAFLIGIMSGVAHNVILFRHVMQYMKHRGFDPQGASAAFQLNKTVTAYYKTDDPGEKNMKLILRGLKILFLMA